jgi:hypothetical protein
MLQILKCQVSFWFFILIISFPFGNSIFARNFCPIKPTYTSLHITAQNIDYNRRDFSLPRLLQKTEIADDHTE